MTGTKVEFIPGYSLFFTNFGQKKLYELLGVKTQRQFMNLLNTRSTDEAGLSNEELEKMILAGLIWEHKSLTLEDTQDLVERYYISGKGFEDLNEVIIDAFAESGLMDKKRVQALRNLKDKTPEELEKELLEMMATKKTVKGEDKGEVLKT